ncbi:TPA: NAD(P)H-hydrate dehydratase [Candidatus Bathyarchaeota archaeon]|nr:NAD(P)H-hydrate dehydratase [Candidatus Bathyarchaeota archaeon]
METYELITTKEMRILESNAEYYGISRLLLMENAGRNIAVEIASRFKPEDSKIAIFCGLGGNGGDGFVAARHLACLGFDVSIILAGRSKEIVSEEAKKNWDAIESLKNLISIYEVYDSSLIPELDANVAVDSLLGIGIKGYLRPPILQIVKYINTMDAYCVAVDVPTGIDSDTGEVLGEAVKANLTVTFHKAKPGLLRAKEYVGELVVRHIGIPKVLEKYAGPGDVRTIVKPRPPESHKGDFGRLLVIGGSSVYYGAPALAALAALRTGVDIAVVAAPEKAAQAISTMSPNLITFKLERDHLNRLNLPVIRRCLEKATAVVIGPGLGLHKETEETIDETLSMIEEKRTPTLLDADGLKAYAKFKRRLNVPLVLTPHAGEFKILTGETLPQRLIDRANVVKRAAQDLDAVILLKSNVDIITDGVRVKFNFTGNPGMTVGGTGDILSGIIGAFLAQGADPFDAATAGSFINGAAGDFISTIKGYHILATDLLEWIPRIVDDPMSHVKVRRSVPQNW